MNETFNIICDYALYFKEIQKILEDRKFKYYVVFPNIHKQKKAYFYIYIDYVSDEDLEFLIKLRRRVHD